MNRKSRGGMPMRTRRRFERRERNVCLLESRRDARRIAVCRLHGFELRVRHDVVKARAVQSGRDGVLAVVGTLPDADVRARIRQPEK